MLNRNSSLYNNTMLSISDQINSYKHRPLLDLSIRTSLGVIGLRGTCLRTSHAEGQRRDSLACTPFSALDVAKLGSQIANLVVDKSPTILVRINLT